MSGVARRFDNYLPNVASDKLKSMVRLWGGTSQLRKDECIGVIRGGLEDPLRVRAAVTGLSPFERTALALIKQMGGEIEAHALAVGLISSGVALPSRLFGPYGDSTNAIFDALFRRGLVFSAYAYDPGYLPGYSSSRDVFSDERLLGEVGLPEIVPFEIHPTTPPPTSSLRRPQTVALNIISLLQAIDNLAGLSVTKSGSVRSTEGRKLMRAMNWEENEIGVDGFRFPNPTQAWMSVLRLAEILKLQEARLVLSESPEQFAVRPYAEQIRLILAGFIRTRSWNEQWNERWQSYHPEYYSVARLALWISLIAIPMSEHGWVAIADLDKAMFDRIGEHFSLDYLPSRPYSFSKTSEQIRKEEEEWRVRLRLNWLKRERKWLEQAFTSWLYFLGLVELGMDRGSLVSFRLTELGRSVLHPELFSEPERSDGGNLTPWVVQPNFDVVVYLDRATPEKLAFLEKHAERVQAQQHTAIYRLTRDSVYRGLENTSSLESLMAGLRAGSEAELPQNVTVEIKEWAALREKITLHRRGRLLEFVGAAARQAAIQSGVEGAQVGERFLLLPRLPVGETGLDMLVGVKMNRLNYQKPLPRCLSVSETGQVRLKTSQPDLMIEAQVSLWAEARSDGGWQLTQASVSKAVERGARISELLELFNQRLTHAFPKLLRVILLAWAGEKMSVDLDTLSLLRCPNDQVFQAIVSSKMFKPYLIMQIAPDVLVVDGDQLEMLKERLAWAGFDVGDFRRELD